jgi:hypothetical protein
MATWVKATDDDTGKDIYLNLDYAMEMHRAGPNANFTLIEFLDRPDISVRETPDELLSTPRRLT